MKIAKINNHWLDSFKKNKNFPMTYDKWAQSQGKKIEWFTVDNENEIVAIFSIDMNVDINNNTAGEIYSFEISEEYDKEDEKLLDTVSKFVCNALDDDFTFETDAIEN